METLNTRISYLYRDADNYKMHNEHKDQYTACGDGVYRLNCQAA